MADEGKVSEMFEELKRIMMGEIRVITTGLADVKGQLEMMNEKLEQISKETDGK